MWIDASHYLSSLYGSNQSAPTSCCGGTLQGARGKQRTYDVYHIHVDNPCWPPTRFCPCYTTTCTSRYVHCTRPHCQKNVVFSHRSRRRKVEWWINMGLGVGWRHRRQIQTPENGLQSRCNHDRPAWWEPCLKRSNWSSYHMIMSLFFLWKLFLIRVRHQTLKWWSRRVRQLSVPKAVRTVKI